MAEAALFELREGIVSGVLAPGSPLRLEELARSLGMSISPVREAVRQLETLGLAVHVPHRGARVTELDLGDLYDTYEARLALETLAVERAADRFTDADAVTAYRHLREYTSAPARGDAAAARRAPAAFHFALYDASGSGWLVRLIRPAWENCERYRALLEPMWGTVAERQHEHEEILAACRQGEAEKAAKLIERHLALTANLVARRMGSHDLF
jgi:DNA-binding GntR family transcriptional regulator